MQWVDDPHSLLQKRLTIADIDLRRSGREAAAAPEGAQCQPRCAGGRLEGLLIYRQWMIDAHRRTKSGMITVAHGPARPSSPSSRRPRAKYAAAEAKAPASAIDLMDWGNILRASGKFDDAIVRIPARHRSRSVERGPGAEHRHRLHRPLRAQCRERRTGHLLVALGSLVGLSGLDGPSGGPYRLAASQGDTQLLARCRSRPGLPGDA